MNLVPVRSDDLAAVSCLYELLTERDETINISHRVLPTAQQHQDFIDSDPYANWYVIEVDGEYVGQCYLTRKDEIGIFVLRDHRECGYGGRAVAMLMDRHPCKQYLANINPRNYKSKKLFGKLGFVDLQHTMVLR